MRSVSFVPSECWFEIIDKSLYLKVKTTKIVLKFSLFQDEDGTSLNSSILAALRKMQDGYFGGAR